MKKVLFATTALIATAGVAAADVTLSGSAEMGLFGGDTLNTTAVGTYGARTLRATQMHTDIDVTFSMSGETDNGLSFGASIDLDESDDADAFGANTQGGETIFIRGDFGTITMGDTDGGYDWGMTEVPTGPGSIQDNEEHAGFNSNSGLDGNNGGQILSYTNTVGGLGYAVSVSVDDTQGAAQADPTIGLGFRYTASTVNIGVGYQTSSTAANVDTDVMGISLGTTIAGLNVGVNFSEQSVDGNAADQTHTGIGVAYTDGAMSVGANYGEFENRGNVLNRDTSGFGFSAGYNLGGGASVKAAWGSSEITSGGVKTSADNWSVGIAMSF